MNKFSMHRFIFHGDHEKGKRKRERTTYTELIYGNNIVKSYDLQEKQYKINILCYRGKNLPS